MSFTLPSIYYSHIVCNRCRIYATNQLERITMRSFTPISVLLVRPNSNNNNKHKTTRPNKENLFVWHFSLSFASFLFRSQRSTKSLSYHGICTLCVCTYSVYDLSHVTVVKLVSFGWPLDSSSPCWGSIRVRPIVQWRNPIGSTNRPDMCVCHKRPSPPSWCSSPARKTQI